MKHYMNDIDNSIISLIKLKEIRYIRDIAANYMNNFRSRGRIFNEQRVACYLVHSLLILVKVSTSLAPILVLKYEHRYALASACS